jgi:hypothetical protein
VLYRDAKGAWTDASVLVERRGGEGHWSPGCLAVGVEAADRCGATKLYECLIDLPADLVGSFDEKNGERIFLGRGMGNSGLPF